MYAKKEIIRIEEDGRYYYVFCSVLYKNKNRPLGISYTNGVRIEVTSVDGGDFIVNENEAEVSLGGAESNATFTINGKKINTIHIAGKYEEDDKNQIDKIIIQINWFFMRRNKLIKISCSADENAPCKECSALNMD